MIPLDEVAHVGTAHVVDLLADAVFDVELVNAELIRHRHVAVIWHAACDPVVAAYCLEPPDLVRIAECDAVHLVRAILLEQRAQACDALARGLDIRQHDGEEVLLANAAGDLRLVVRVARLALRWHILDERVGTEHALVRRERLGGAHRHVRFVHAGFAPDPLLAVAFGTLEYCSGSSGSSICTCEITAR